MDDLHDQIEHEVARKLAEHQARQDARNRVMLSRNRRWRTELERREEGLAQQAWRGIPFRTLR